MDHSSVSTQGTTLQTFARLFPSERACIDFLFPLRWPHGFVCPFCRSRQPHCAPQRALVCSHCGNRSSLTTGTLLHGTKKPLRDWLLAIWWFSFSPFEVSAKGLQRLLGVSCYQTAWTWLQKLRQAMALADTEPCRGVVELGCGWLAPAHERKERALILTAAEAVLGLNLSGRIRMRHIPLLDDRALFLFLQDNVRETSTLLTGDAHLVALLPDCGAYCLAPTPSDDTSRIHQLHRSVESCLHSVHRGGVTARHLQLYLDEFCFRNNASLLADHQAVFKALLSGVLNRPIGRCPVLNGLSARVAMAEKTS